MTERVLDIRVGRIAKKRIAAHGWDPSLFTVMLGASGGPKWLVLSQIDRVLFGEFLPQRTAPLHVLGTSIGSWRHACLAQKDPLAAIGRMEQHYIHQRYETKPTPKEVTDVSLEILQQTLGSEGHRHIADNKEIITHVGTVRGRGPLAYQQLAVHGLGLGLAALSNAVHRSWLQPWYQRVVFSGDGSGRGTGFQFSDFATKHVQLTQENVIPALMASASIPMTLEGVLNPPGARPGLYWDGGIVDYHHDLRAYQDDGLLLYPHFYNYVIPGWFDKGWKRRRPKGEVLDRVVQISPSEAFVRSLPRQKIPDRKDFQELTNDERIEHWWQVIERCKALGNALRELLVQPDPLAGVDPF